MRLRRKFERWKEKHFLSMSSGRTPKRHLVYSLKTRESAITLLKDLKAHGHVVTGGHECSTISDLAVPLNVPRQTLISWESKSWNKENLKKRLSNRGKKPKLNGEQQKVLRDWIVDRFEAHKVTGWLDIANETEKKFGWKPKQPWVSKFAKKWKIASHMTQRRPTKRIRDTIEHEMKLFVSEVNEIEQSCILFHKSHSIFFADFHRLSMQFYNTGGNLTYCDYTSKSILYFLQNVCDLQETVVYRQIPLES